MNLRELSGLQSNGVALYNQRRYKDALVVFERICQLVPDQAIPLVNLAQTYGQLGQTERALKAFRSALTREPDSLGVLRPMSQMLLGIGRPDEAIPLLQRLHELEPNSIEGKLRLTQALMEQNRFEEAERTARETIELSPENAAGYETLSGVLRQMGRFDDAIAALQSAMRLDPKKASLILDYATCRKMTEIDRPVIEEFASRLGGSDVGNEEKIATYFAAGKFHDDLGEFEAGMRNFDQAHELSEQGLRSTGQQYDPVQMKSRFDWIQKTFSGMNLNVAAGSESSRPLLVIGMVRSGTTLVEHILSRHSQIGSGGELSFWPLNWGAVRGGDKKQLDADLRSLASRYQEVLESIDSESRYVIDKMPGNFVWLGVIKAAFPNAKVIYCRRNAIDNGISIYTTPFRSSHNWVHTRENIVDYYRLHLGLMKHWFAQFGDEIYEVAYEDLVTDPKATTLGMLDYLGLDWEEQCLSPEENSRPVRTPSHWQVRQPVFTQSVERWRNYEPWLGALANLNSPSTTS